MNDFAKSRNRLPAQTLPRPGLARTIESASSPVVVAPQNETATPDKLACASNSACNKPPACEQGNAQRARFARTSAAVKEQPVGRVCDDLRGLGADDELNHRIAPTSLNIGQQQAQTGRHKDDFSY
eukprot:1639751-Pleurochrysis_carterae.AAC.1